MAQDDAGVDDYRATQQEHFALDAEARDAENERKGRTYAKKATLLIPSLHRARAILEVGCGSGLFTDALARALPSSRITATDAFEPVLERARQRVPDGRVRFQAFDAESSVTPEQLGGPFDAVCGVDIVHHLEHPVEALAGWRHLVTPGGRLAILESNPKNPVLFARHYGRPAEKRFFLNTRRNLAGWTTAAGWDDVEVTYAPLYLPNGPASLWASLGMAESVMHRLVVFRPISGLFLVRAVRRQ
jgi:2-polyprenyl-3-methyl-5-hydroxy-6-metoxy-1,4-benzoquinol methylase